MLRQDDTSWSRSTENRSQLMVSVRYDSMDDIKEQESKDGEKNDDTTSSSVRAPISVNIFFQLPLAHRRLSCAPTSWARGIQSCPFPLPVGIARIWQQSSLSNGPPLKDKTPCFGRCCFTCGNREKGSKLPRRSVQESEWWAIRTLGSNCTIITPVLANSFFRIANCRSSKQCGVQGRVRFWGV